MELLVIFAIGWVASHAFGEKRDEYSASQDAHRQKYLAKLKNDHPSWGPARSERYLQNAARRNALGHFAYLLRHGWSSTFNDFGDGWQKAKAAHEVWKAERPENGKKTGWWATLKAGWKDAAKSRRTATSRRRRCSACGSRGATWHADAKPPAWFCDECCPCPRPENGDSRGYYAGRYADGATTPAAPTPSRNDTATPSEKGTDRRPDPNVVPISRNTPGKTNPGNAGTTNGSTPVEAPNLDAAKAVISQVGQDAMTKASGLEQVHADTMAGGLNADSESMGHLVSLQEALQNVSAHADAFVASVGKHESGQEYANSGHAAKTDYLKSN